MKFRMIKCRRLHSTLSIKALRFQHKFFIAYSFIITIILAIFINKYIQNCNADQLKFIDYDNQIISLNQNIEYYKSDAQMLAETTGGLIDMVTELNIDRDLLIADNCAMQVELDEFYERSELYDRYEFFIFDKRGERNDLSYDRLRNLEQMIEGTSIPNPELILSIIYLESSGHADAVNGQGSGASGLGQFMPGTARSVWQNLLGNDPDEWSPEMIFDADLNLQMTVAYMDYLIEKHGGPREALRQYSGSGTNTDHLNGYIATLNAYLRHTEVGSFANVEAQYRDMVANSNN